MKYELKPEHEILAREFINLHFNGAPGITHVFPCMRDDYPWSNHRPDVIDSRIPAKFNNEYHGLERHAAQYHATAQYDFSYHHWLIAAYWRTADAHANGFSDPAHQKAIHYCVKQALYNKSLDAWQKNQSSSIPTPEQFELSSADIDKKDVVASIQLEPPKSK
jgi:hypothetical protein